MQNVTHIAPAIAAFFFTPLIVSFAGGHAPLAYLIGFVVVLALGMCLVQLAKRFPSAGGYYTYVSRTLGPRLGFLTGWLYALYSPIVAGPALAFLGVIIQGELSSYYHVTWFQWWILVVVGLPLIALAGYLGITLSVRTIVIVGALEFLIVLALGLSGLISPGPGGFTFSSFSYGFNPGHIATSSGFALAVVFTVQGLTGWEAAVPLAEETKDPKRNVPRATMTSIAIIGAMLVIVIWGQVIGWGTSDLTKLPTLGGIAGPDDRAPGLGEPVVAGPDRDVHVGLRREPGLPERRHPDVVRHGPQRRAARDLRPRAPGPQDADAGGDRAARHLCRARPAAGLLARRR